MEDKNEDEKRRFQRSSWSRLGPILGRFGGRLGIVEWGFAPAKLRFLKIHMFEEIRCEEATWFRSWVDLDAQEAPKRRPRRIQT